MPTKSEVKEIDNELDENISLHKPFAKNSKLNKILGIPEVGVLIPLFLIVIILTALRPGFLGIANLQAVFRSVAFWGIVAIGETLVILIGEIDVSVGSNVALGSIVVSWLMTFGHVAVIPSVLIAVLLCTLVGYINGFLVVKLKIQSFITTIAMLYAARGIAKAITNARFINGLPDSFTKVGAYEPFGTSVGFVLFIVLIIAFEFILRKTSYGRYIYATGDNRSVAKLAGINIDRIRISTFVITGFLCGVAGILVTSQLATGSPMYGDGWELSVVAATAIGGISLMGGAGTMLGTLLGIFIMAALNNGLVLLEINSFFINIIIGIVMILAVFIDILRRNKKLGSGMDKKSTRNLSNRSFHKKGVE